MLQSRRELCERAACKAIEPAPPAGGAAVVRRQPLRAGPHRPGRLPQRVEWARGDGALAAARGAEHELAAIADFAAARPDWTVSVSRCAAAWPGGPIDDDVFETFADELLHDLQHVQPHAMYLSLHGAAITQALHAPETALLQRARAALGPRLLLASFDLHANLDPRVGALLDFASAYRTYPHVDLRATAARVLAPLDALCRGERKHGCVLKLGALLPSHRMRSALPPMAELLAQARALEAAHPGTDISLLGGFPYADTPHADAGVMVWSGDAATAQALAGRMLEQLRERQRDFDVTLPSPAEGLTQAIELMHREAAAATPKMVALTDPADNPLSGGGADTPSLLRELLAQRHRLPAPDLTRAWSSPTFSTPHWCNAPSPPVPAANWRCRSAAAWPQHSAPRCGNGRACCGCTKAASSTPGRCNAATRSMPGALRCSRCRASASSSPARWCRPTTRPSSRTTVSGCKRHGCCA